MVNGVMKRNVVSKKRLDPIVQCKSTVHSQEKLVSTVTVLFGPQNTLLSEG